MEWSQLFLLNLASESNGSQQIEWNWNLHCLYFVPLFLDVSPSFFKQYLQFFKLSEVTHEFWLWRLLRHNNPDLQNRMKSTEVKFSLHFRSCDLWKANLNIAPRAQNGSNGTNGQHVNGNGALASAELLRSETASGNPVQVVGHLSFPIHL